MNKTLFKSIREYKKQSLLAPLLVILEVLMEVLIPLEMAKIIDVGIANGDLGYIVQRGVILVIMAMLALYFGVQAGNMAAKVLKGEDISKMPFETIKESKITININAANDLGIKIPNDVAVKAETVN